MQQVKIVLAGQPVDRSAAQAATDTVALALPTWARQVTASLHRSLVGKPSTMRIIITGRCETLADAEGLWTAVQAAMPADFAAALVEFEEDLAAARKAEWQAETAALIAAKVAADVTAVTKVYEVLDKAALDPKVVDDLKAAIAASTGVAASQEAAVKS